MNSQKRDVVMITGASAGVGRATAQAFARRGARIGLLARDVKALEDTRKEVESFGGEALVLPADVSRPDEVEKAAQSLEEKFGPMDVWINDAMVSVFSAFHEITAEEFRRVTEVTYLGYVHGTLSALRRMRPRNRGTIVQVGSALGHRGIPLQSAYCGAKHAIEGFTESLRSELLHDRIRVHVTVVNLPAVNTPQFRWVKSRLRGKPQPVPPIYQPEVAAEAIFWAAHHRRREINVGLPTSLAVVGNNFLPTFGDRYLARTGYRSQQTSEPDDPGRPNNLWEPVSGQHGVHGDFDARSSEKNPQFWFATHKGWWTAALALGGMAAVRFWQRLAA